ncbi:MAG: PD-(D/E)XK nuclease family protein [Pseudomonadota bacterium]
MGPIERPALLERLAAGATALTASRRLARFLKREFDCAQRNRDLHVWPTPDILPLTAWLQRAYADAAPPDAPLLLSPLQEQVLWERAVAESESASPLLQIPSTAAAAREAWQLAHAYRLREAIERLPLNEDARAFVRWSQRYRKLAEEAGAIELARLPDQVAGWIRAGAIDPPREAVLCGFDEVAPQQRELFGALEAAGCALAELAPPRRSPDVRRVELLSAQDEITVAARWARARLEANPDARVGVVIPDLSKHRRRAVRTFARIMRPAVGLPGTPGGPLPFNVSLGEPLADAPLVASALAALDLLRGEIELEALGTLLRSPFLGGAEGEATRRALLDAELRARGEPVVDLRRLRAAALAADSRGEPKAHTAPDLAHRLEGLIALAESEARQTRSPSEWMDVFFAALRTLGFPGERALASEEFQAFETWRDLLGSVGTLDTATPRIGLGAALSRVRRMAADTVFQPETPEVPVQILGALEAANLEFDHLWVTGLTDEAWPGSPRPSPFLPIPLQVRERLPHASADRELAFARRLTEGWQASADELVLSHPKREDDRELGVSPLIAAVPAMDVSALGLGEDRGYRDIIHAAHVIESFTDVRGPAHPAGARAQGGSSVFRDQAACPFRAFAAHRLASASLDVPQRGLTPMERGVLLHDVLARVWAQVRSRAALAAMDAARLGAVVEAAASHAIGDLMRRRPRTLAGRYGALEKERLARLTLAWLEVERARGDFEVEATEEKREITVGGVTVRGKLDRVDRLPDGRRAVIDYKTGEANPRHWEGERPEEPQLPLYAVGSPDAVAAVAFAQVKIGGMEFKGVAAGDVGIPGVRAAADWDGLLGQWRQALEALGRSFAAGDADVSPKKFPHTCEYCDQAPLCRINERLRIGPVEAEGGDD